MDFYELETSLFKEKFLSNKDYLEKVLHNDYIEYGKSGLIYNKKETIESLYRMKDRNITISKFTSKKIDEKTYIIHYISTHENDINVLRTSIWINESNKWKLYFHQGTKMN